MLSVFVLVKGEIRGTLGPKVYGLLVVNDSLIFFTRSLGRGNLDSRHISGTRFFVAAVSMLCVHGSASWLQRRRKRQQLPCALREPPIRVREAAMVRSLSCGTARGAVHSSGVWSTRVPTLSSKNLVGRPRSLA